MDPSREETWAAVAGWGARRNGRPCRVASGRSTLATALVATGFGYQSARREWQGAVAAQVLPRVRDIRRFGAAALDLCWTAGGRFDAYYEWGLNPWDLAAGALICAEAGGRVASVPGPAHRGDDAGVVRSLLRACSPRPARPTSRRRAGAAGIWSMGARVDQATARRDARSRIPEQPS